MKVNYAVVKDRVTSNSKGMSISFFWSVPLNQGLFGAISKRCISDQSMESNSKASIHNFETFRRAHAESATRCRGPVVKDKLKSFKGYGSYLSGPTTVGYRRRESLAACVVLGQNCIKAHSSLQMRVRSIYPTVEETITRLSSRPMETENSQSCLVWYLSQGYRHLYQLLSYLIC
jgi:hypothetical protein